MLEGGLRGWLCLIWLYLAEISVTHCAEIRRLSIPRWVRNGSSEGVVLDCDYVYNENDLRLVVKWFFNDDLEPLYQWIPELNVRHVSGLLYGRLDMAFSVNPFDPYSQYRALRIVTASAELSGKYTCLVTSMAGQDSRHQDMTVFVPARSFRFSFSTGSEEQVTFTCSAEGVVPEPRMQLFTVSHKKRSKSAVTDAISLVTSRNTTYDITLNKNISERHLVESGVTVLECVLEIPGSPYRRAKRITYFAGIGGLQHWSSDSVSTSHKRPLLVITSIFLFATKNRYHLDNSWLTTSNCLEVALCILVLTLTLDSL